MSQIMKAQHWRVKSSTWFIKALQRVPVDKGKSSIRLSYFADKRAYKGSP